MGTEIHTGELLFVKSVKDGIPNRDPLRDSDARRIFGEEDGRISLSDVSIKRDVRDYILARYPDGGPAKNLFIFVRKEFTESGKLRGREGLALSILEKAYNERTKEIEREKFFQVAFDARVFGVVFSVGGKAFNQCGPVQFGWAHSLHPVETKYVQGTVVMPSREGDVELGGDEEGATMGTIWSSYICPFAVFAMPAVVSAPIARDTGMSGEDLDMLLEALWRGTLSRQARGRGIQQPLLLIHVEYNDPYFRLGYLEEGIKLLPERDAWLGPTPPTALADITIDVANLGSRLKTAAPKIHRVRIWQHPQLSVTGEIAGERMSWASA
ncbi:MAG: type I CRISPR-associated protein Cas7 [candidate division KSB1 bacterium]|nr:type I CRISPR-associated protein Cas7 [candidate division KSB1 bacterium]MDZ7413420.1 type I CRISPR-associated protein Cas7 [candidate division KSB1 bacterium]